MKVRSFGTLVFAISLPLLAGFIGSIFTIPAIDTWYATLNKPSFNPPNYIFAPVWTTLYILMGISFYLVLISKVKNKSYAIGLFLLQLVLNALWSYIFFGLHNPLLALFEIIFLWGAVLYTTTSFDRISNIASYVIFPYVIWVSFAFILNLSIVILNP